MPNADKPIKVGYLVVDGFTMMSFSCAIETLVAANMVLGRNYFFREVFTPDGKPVTSSSNLSIGANDPSSISTELDWLFVIAGYNYRDFATPAVCALIRKLSRNTTLVGGIGSGSWLLAQAGLLNQQRVTIHWQELPLFREKFPDLNILDQRYVIDGRRASAGGAVATMDLILELVRQTCGESVFFDVSNLFLYDFAQSGERSQRRHALTKATAPRLHKVIELMERTVETPLSLKDIAQEASMSLRSLNRLFQKEVGLSPGQFYLHLRLKVARRLIAETKLSVSEIALRSGFNSPQAFCRAFQTQFATTPNSLRKGRQQSLLKL